jgi:phosphoribosylanthranilate isomerase
MTLVKICGLTRQDDVRLATGLGAWACGFVLTDSPRRVTFEQAAELARAARPALTVAVVTTEAADWVAAALQHTGLAAVQLSAGADGPTVAETRAAASRCGLRPLVLAARDTPDAAEADFRLLDARLPGRYGGTGRTVDWAAIPQMPADDRLVLAGGLTPLNVAKAIGTVRPLAVDVSGGVEQRPGVKDRAKLRDFFAAVSRADGRRTHRARSSARPDPLREVNP